MFKYKKNLWRSALLREQFGWYGFGSKSMNLFAGFDALPSKPRLPNKPVCSIAANAMLVRPWEHVHQLSDSSWQWSFLESISKLFLFKNHTSVLLLERQLEEVDQVAECSSHLLVGQVQ
jgi:hypothetical protein